MYKTFTYLQRLIPKVHYRKYEEVEELFEKGWFISVSDNFVSAKEPVEVVVGENTAHRI